jgi:hypothetical protein
LSRRPGAQICNDQGILPQLALRMAAPDPHKRGHQRLEDPDRAVIVALGECLSAAAKADRGRTWGEFAVGLTRFHLRQSGCQNFVAGCRCDQGVVDIGKMRARLREEPIAISSDFLPIGVQTCLAEQREPPEQRG